MTVEQFNALDDLEQAQAVSRGVRVKVVVMSLYKFILYDLNGLYVEVKYNLEDNIVESFQAVQEVSDLGSFYDNDISDLTDLI